MNVIDIILIILVVLVLGLALRGALRRRKSGGCGCDGCARNDTCGGKQ